MIPMSDDEVIQGKLHLFLHSDHQLVTAKWLCHTLKISLEDAYRHLQLYLERRGSEYPEMVAKHLLHTVDTASGHHRLAVVDRRDLDERWLGPGKEVLWNRVYVVLGRPIERFQQVMAAVENAIDLPPKITLKGVGEKAKIDAKDSKIAAKESKIEASALKIEAKDEPLTPQARKSSINLQSASKRIGPLDILQTRLVNSQSSGEEEPPFSMDFSDEEEGVAATLPDSLGSSLEILPAKPTAYLMQEIESQQTYPASQSQWSQTSLQQQQRQRHHYEENGYLVTERKVEVPGDCKLVDSRKVSNELSKVPGDNISFDSNKVSNDPPSNQQPPAAKVPMRQGTLNAFFKKKDPKI